MHLRTADAADLPVLCELRIAFLAEHRAVDPDTLLEGFARDTRAFFERTMSSGTIRSWLVEHDGRAIGIASVVLHDVPPVPEDHRSHEGYVINMYVRPEFRGRGVGRRLLDACLGTADEQGIRRFYLYATPSGRPMYEHAGFAPHDDWMVLRVPRS